MQQQRDALLIICIPCIDSEREGGGGASSESRKQWDHLQLLLDNVWGGEICLKLKIRKKRDESPAIPMKQIACKAMAKQRWHGHHNAWRLTPDIE